MEREGHVEGQEANRNRSGEVTKEKSQRVTSTILERGTELSGLYISIFLPKRTSSIDCLGITRITLVSLFPKSYLSALLLFLSHLTLKQQVENEAEEESLLMEPTSFHPFLGSSLGN